MRHNVAITLLATESNKMYAEFEKSNNASFFIPLR